MKSCCKNPTHKVHLANFVTKYPTAKGRVPQTILLVDTKDWAVALEHPTLNTTECCQVCSIAEDIAQAKKGIGTTGLGQSCSCQPITEKKLSVMSSNKTCAGDIKQARQRAASSQALSRR
jgi:hypothetical protein